MQLRQGYQKNFAKSLAAVHRGDGSAAAGVDSGPETQETPPTEVDRVSCEPCWPRRAERRKLLEGNAGASFFELSLCLLGSFLGGAFENSLG